MRKTLLILLGISFLIFLVGCGNKDLKESNFVSIHSNMTTSEVKKVLGKPDKVIENADKVRGIDKKEEKAGTDSFISKYPDSIINFFKTSKEKKNC